MAFQTPNTGQEKANRRILEQLEEQKRKLRIQTQGPTAAGPPPASGSVSAPGATPQSQATQQSGGNLLAEPAHMNPAQRAALQHAHANSVGYFITQESSFGNLILPVLPRFDKP